MPKISKIKVSSVLNKNIKEYGKQFLIDGDCESCWQSDKSLNGTQTINLTLEQPTQLSGISIQFQGGFAANQVQITSGDIELEKIHPEDSNKLQEFKFAEKTVELEKLKLCMTESHDFYGRIIIYQLLLV
jgi:hypothetical protein